MKTLHFIRLYAPRFEHSIFTVWCYHSHARWPRTTATRNMHDPRTGAAAPPRTDRDAHRYCSPC
eukprot:5232788-Prymnesium_polylepis.1